MKIDEYPAGLPLDSRFQAGQDDGSGYPRPCCGGVKNNGPEPADRVGAALRYDLLI